MVVVESKPKPILELRASTNFGMLGLLGVRQLNRPVLQIPLVAVGYSTRSQVAIVEREHSLEFKVHQHVGTFYIHLEGLTRFDFPGCLPTRKFDKFWLTRTLG
ncbi:hypothetical protein A8E62_09780 [Burkholderia cenocepacia]|nr:hypothetical protein A8E62_09780 [Burkholderia cenocepacia]ONU93817.1 hypothetical protein A8E63_06830 [Burkholderia cenocepacia]